jgi:hypothetical protein
VHSKTLRIGDDRAKGYESAAFANAFDRYLPRPGQFTRDSVTCGEKDGFEAVTNGSVVTDEKSPSTEGMSRRHVENTVQDNPEISPEPDFQLVGEEALLL